MSAQSSEGYKQTWDSLSKQVGVTVEVDKAWESLHAKKDSQGMAKLKQLSKKQRR